MSRNTRNFARHEDDDKKDTINKLRAQIRQMEKYIDELKSENMTLVEAWAKTEAFLEEITAGVPLEDLLKYKKLPKRALQKKSKVDGKLKRQEDEKQKVLEKWQKWNKERN